MGLWALWRKISPAAGFRTCPVSLRHSSETFLHPEPQTYFFASFRVLEDEGLPRGPNPEGPTYTTIMESGPQTKIGMVFWGPNSIGSVYGPSGEVLYDPRCKDACNTDPIS